LSKLKGLLKLTVKKTEFIRMIKAVSCV